MFRSLILLQNAQIFKGNVKFKIFYIGRVGTGPLFNVQKKIFFLAVIFGQVSTILA